MNVPPKTALAALAHEAGGWTLDAVPEVVREQARLCILDTVGCMIAGAATEEARLILACETPDGRTATATVAGTAERRSCEQAARINGYLGDVLELNDLIGGHASIGNVSAALALAESLDTCGAALLEAVIHGIEITTRVYSSVYPSLKRYTAMGLVPVGIPSAIGVGAACARLLGLDETRRLHAMAIAGSLAGWCPAEVIFGDGGSVKPMLFGAQPAAVGIDAAQRAQAGMTGPVALLDSKLGYFATTSEAGVFDPAQWQNRWALSAPRRKLHACCGYLHAPVDAIGQLRAKYGHDLQGAMLEVRIAPYVVDAVSKSAPPSSPNDARFHLQYCAALALCGADAIEPAHSIAIERHLARPEVAAAMARVRVVADPALVHYHGCRVSFEDAQGCRHEQAVNAPRGAPDAPLSDTEVTDKFMRLATPVIGECAARAFADAVASVEQMPSVARLMQMVAL